MNPRLTRNPCPCLALILLLGATGCATSRFAQPLEIKQQSVALAITIPDKSAEFFEMGSGPLGLLTPKSVDNSYTYEGLWDSSEPLLQAVAEAEPAVVLRPLGEALPAERYLAVKSACETALNSARTQGQASFTRGPAALQEWRNSPPLGYLHEPPPGELLEAARTAQASYILEICLSGLVYTSTGSKSLLTKGFLDMVPSTFWAGFYGRLIRVSDGQVVRYAKAQASHSVGYIRTFSEVEKDDLKRLKEDYDQALTALFTKQPFLRKLTE